MLIFRISSYVLAFFTYLYSSGNFLARAEDAYIKDDKKKQFKYTAYMLFISFGFILLAINELKRIGVGIP